MMRKIHVTSQICSFFILAIIVVSSVSPVISYAYNPSTASQNIQYTLLEPLPCVSDGTGKNCTAGTLITTADNFGKYAQYMFNLIIALGAVAAVFMIVWGGFKYATTDSFYDKSEGRKIIWDAVQGLLLILCSYLILRTIDPRLVNVPTTIVKPINVNISTNLATSFLDQMANQANQSTLLGDNKAAAKQIIADAKTEVAGLEAKLAQLSAEYNAAIDSRDDERAGMIAADMETVKGDIQKVNSRVAVQTTAVSMLTGVNTSLATAGIALNDPLFNSASNSEQLKAISSRVDQINTLYTAGVNQLKEIGNPPDPDQLKLLEDQKNFSLGMLAMQKDAIQAQSSLGAKAGAILEAAKVGVSAGTNMVLSPRSALSGVASAPQKIYDGYARGTSNAFVTSVTNDVIKGYAEKITDVNLKNQLIETANSAIAAPGQ